MTFMGLGVGADAGVVGAEVAAMAGVPGP